MPQTEVYGIRHHGPGSARALRQALEDFKPDVVLIEGPPEADAIVELAADPEMVPPVALLAYAVPPPGKATTGDGPGRRAAFWPFAEFSPEWQAIRFAVGAGVPARFCDLPAAHQLADDQEDAEPGSESGQTAERVRLDPLGWLAQVAGYDDAERWWDDVVEHRGEGPSPFPAIAEAMTVLREDLATRSEGGAPLVPPAHARREEQREAHMRRTLRRTLKDGYERVAVVCGAWHVPALQAVVPASRDDQALRGLPKEKVAVTWVPWTHGRLAHWSGYGAGVRSPGWYHHLFAAADRPIERWLTQAARLLREEDLHVSSAHVIEAVRLAEALATLRGRPLAGLDEVTEATRAVLCEGAELPLELIQRRMVVGERLGAVPGSTPMVPLQRDLQAEQRRLRLKPSALDKEHDLDLRRPIDLDRSRLLHRLRLLGVDWGEPAEDGGRSKGTFRETWSLMWRPEFDVELIEAGAWGTTVRGAAGAKARALAAESAALADLTSLAERCLLADLGDALPEVMRALADRAATDADVVHLMAALPALVRVLRYGDVRGTATGPLRAVVDGLVVRVCIGLPPAVSGLDDDAAKDLLKHINTTHESLALLSAIATPPIPPPAAAATGLPAVACGQGEGGDQLTRWRRTLLGLLDRPGLHGLLEGRLTRLLHDGGLLSDVADRMARAVSVGEEPGRAAAWVEGFLSGGGLVLVHDEELLRLVDGWITGLAEESFTDVLPLLRRTFGEYAAPERRAIGERARRLDARPSPGATRTGGGDEDDIDAERAAPVVRAVTHILGWPAPHEAEPARGRELER